MGFDVMLHQEPIQEYVEVDARLCVTEDGKRLVPEGDLDARWLFCVPGQKIPRREAEKYGLIEALSFDPEHPGPHEAGGIPAESVPDGSAAVVLEWVGDDEARAQRALDAEAERGRPRKGLTAELEALVGSDAQPGGAASEDDQGVPE